MSKAGGNGGENGDAKYCHTFGDSVKYPVRFDLKAIIEASISPEESITSLESVFIKHKVPFSNWRQKSSSGGKYISYNVSVVVDSRETMNHIDRQLRNIVGVKMVM